jgi:hypothetical protein
MVEKRMVEIGGINSPTATRAGPILFDNRQIG